MKKTGRSSVAWLSAGIILLLSIPLLAGCGGGTTTTGASGQTGAAGQGETKVLAIGEKGANQSAEVTVDKITTTNNLDSSEAAALLMTGESGEQKSNYGSKGTPASGNEFLMVTLNFKNINAKPPKVTPDSLKLKNSQGKDYQEVSTGGNGGIYNMPQVDPGKERKATVVYEVPKGETGLILTYQPYGADAIQFKVR